MVRFLFVLLLGLVLALLLLNPAAAQRYNVPLAAPPAGFAWQPLPDGKAAALLPAGWYYRAEGQQGAPPTTSPRSPSAKAASLPRASRCKSCAKP